MTSTIPGATWLAGAVVDPAVYALRPDYRAMLIFAENLTPGPSDAVSERILADAEARARRVTAETGPDPHPHVAAWREAFRAFGAKPQRTRPSVDALIRRLDDGLPRIDRVTDAYNAVSIAHVLPIGGEDADQYRGPLRLARAAGDEEFETVSGGEAAIEHPAAGEVVWRDEAGVTCRRWNWRQCTRTRITTATTRAIFVLDVLEPMSDEALGEAGQALCDALRALSPDARFATRTLRR